ncbi:flavin reductase family protein [Brevundimonas sp.]|uniref:flavin reductase family protein n=1 Tax=Brevundimonas sp. TaxID=1871086 RepID=UPI0035B2F9C4
MTVEPTPYSLPAEAGAYRRALGAFATGVCVITADTAEGPLGITVNSFTSVSLEPRLILWCLDEQSERWPIFAAAERFAVHVLAAEDEAEARRFARGVCRLEPEEFTRSPDGTPRLHRAAAWFDCATHDRLPLGDHMVIVGRVEAFEAEDRPVLTFHRGRYGWLGDAQ